MFIDYVLGLYDVFLWLDIPMHFLGGFSVGYMLLLFFRFFEEENLIKINNKFIFIIMAVALVSFVAVLWEFYEFIMLNFGFPWQESTNNLLLDLFMGVCGGLTSVILFRKV